MNQTPNQKNIIENSLIQVTGNFHQGDVTYINNYFAAQEVKIPHRLTNNIPTNADHILGRATELAQAQDHLAQHQATVLFNGIGGIGKTALASKYMALYGTEYKHLAWITVQSTLAEAFTNNAPLLASLQVTQQVQDYIATKQLDKAFEYLFHQLNLLEHTLVVIDNANDLDDLDQYKNWFDTAHCHFLITSRSQPSEWATVEVDSLPEDEAIRLFRKLHPSVSTDDEAIKNLLSKLFYHTLLIELVAKAGATIGIPFADLQTMIETQFIHHQSLNESPIPTGKHGSVVATNPKKQKIEDYIWLIFNQVKGLDEGSKHLLKAMALLPVATPFDLDFLKAHFAFFNISDAVVQLDALIERGWLQKEQAEGQKPYFKMHPLIGDVMVEHLGVDIEFAEGYIWHVAKLIYYDTTNPEHNVFEKNKSKTLSERLNNLFFKVNNEGISILLENLGHLEDNFGFYHKAIDFKERALEIMETVFGKNHSKTAIRQSNLANVYSKLGNDEKAKILLESALEGSEIKFGEDIQMIIHLQSNLANVYNGLGQKDRAIALLEKALENNLKTLGINDPIVAINQSCLANVYADLKQYERAVELLKLALENDILNFGEEHPKVTVRQSNLGDIFTDLKHYDLAIPLLEKALDSDLKKFGENYPEVAIKQSNLAKAYFQIKRKEEAKNLWKSAYENYRENVGEEHPFTKRFKKYSEI
jgi:tetratricopeptide (TPR) repeat protein